MRKNIFLLLLLLPTLLLCQNSTRMLLSQEQSGNTISLTTSDGKYRIVFYNDNVVETSFVPTGETYNADSHAVVLNPASIAVKNSETASGSEYSTAGISVHVQKSPLKITYFYKGKELISEKSGYSKTDKAEIIDFNLDATEVLYGGGARVLGMNRRGNRLQLYNRAHYGYGTRSELLNFTMPIVMSSKMYTIHFDNATIGHLDLDSKKDNTLAYETISGRKTYQVIAGDSWEGLMQNYTALTGRQPMPPRWTFGNFASRFGYHSEKETRETVAKFEAEKIPLDAIILDLYWFGKEVKGTMGNLAFDHDNFPEPQKMMSDFNKKGIKTILITEPFILTTSKRWDEAVRNNILATDKLGKPFTYDFYFGNTGLIDIFKPEGKDWFWNIYKDLNNDGVSGWWGDLGEPEVHPTDLQHATGSADELHNIYGHQWAKLVFEGYQKDFPEQRPFILMRSGYSGSQRYGMIPWSGDVSRSWEGLSGQPEIALQMGMQGLAYMHSDLGGFAGATLDDELYTRWLQYGVFQPVFRPHAQEDVPSEPVFREEKTKQLAKKAIELRYQMLPYNYTLAFENNQHGTPLMRPVFFEEPENTVALSSASDYFWGNDFLVSPVLKAGISEQQIYFPKSNNWFDFYTGTKYAAGTTQNVKVAAHHIPVFVRGGAFIPMIETIQNTQSYSIDNLNLHYYFDNSVSASNGHLYNDDGQTPNAFEKGKFEMLKFRSKFTKGKLVLFINPEKGTFTSNDKNINIIVHGFGKKPKKILIGDKKVKVNWDKKSKLLQIKTQCSNDSSKEIHIQTAE